MLQRGKSPAPLHPCRSFLLYPVYSVLSCFFAIKWHSRVRSTCRIWIFVVHLQPHSRDMRAEAGIADVTEDAQIPKWPTGADCKSAGFAFGGSNPPLRTRQGERKVPGCGHWFSSWICGSSSVDRALAFQAEGRGFESRLPLLVQSLRGCDYGNKCRFSSVVERILGKDEVPSSTLGSGSYAKCEGVDETALLRWSP